MQKLLLLHGAIGSKEQMKPLADQLNDVYEVRTMNFLGHGGEELPNEFSIQAFAEQLNSYIDQNKLSPVNIFGYSMGGYVALYLAGYHPEKIKSVFTLGTKFDWTVESAQKESKMLIPEKIEEKVPALAKTLAERHSPQNWKQVVKLTSDMMIKMGIDPPLGAHLFSHIAIPILVSVGDKDQMVSTMETIEVNGKLKNSKMLVMLDTPHPIEQVDLSRLKIQLVDFFANSSLA